LFGLPKKLAHHRQGPQVHTQAACFRHFARCLASKARCPQQLFIRIRTARRKNIVILFWRIYFNQALHCTRPNWHWDDLLLPAAEFAVNNNSVNESTGETPAFFLMQGQQHPLTPVTIQTDSDDVPAQQGSLLPNFSRQTIIKVQHNLRKAQERQKAYIC